MDFTLESDKACSNLKKHEVIFEVDTGDYPGDHSIPIHYPFS